MSNLMLANCVQEGWPLRQEMQERNSRSPPHMTSSLLRTERHASYLSFLDAWAYLEHTPEHTLEHTPEHTLEMYQTFVSSKLCHFIWPPSPRTIKLPWSADTCDTVVKHSSQKRSWKATTELTNLWERPWTKECCIFSGSYDEQLSDL